MAEKKKGTLQELTERVHGGLELLSDQDLAVLFEEAGGELQNEPITEEPKEPSVAPAPAEPAPPAGEPAKGQADLMNLVPEKFRDKDEAASLNKMVKALQEAEASLTQKSQELSQLQNVVQELSTKPSQPVPTYQPMYPKTEPKKGEPEPEIDDASFFENAVENSRRIAREEARKATVEGLREYDTFSIRRNTLERFKVDHPDFDNYRNEFVEACRMHPEWDNDLSALPKLYEAARAIAQARARVINPQPQPQSQPVIDVEKLKAEIRAELEASSYDKARQDILNEINRRKAATGIISSTSAVTPQDRINAPGKTREMTAEEKILDEMMKSGPKALDVLRG